MGCSSGTKWDSDPPLSGPNVHAACLRLLGPLLSLPPIPRVALGSSCVPARELFHLHDSVPWAGPGSGSNLACSQSSVRLQELRPAESWLWATGIQGYWLPSPSILLTPILEVGPLTLCFLWSSQCCSADVSGAIGLLLILQGCPGWTGKALSSSRLVLPTPGRLDHTPFPTAVPHNSVDLFCSPMVRISRPQEKGRTGSCC